MMCFEPSVAGHRVESKFRVLAEFSREQTIKPIDKDFSVTAVLAGGQQTGGGFFQALTSLKSLLNLLPDEISLTVLDSRGTFSREIRELQADPSIRDFEIEFLPRRLPTFRDRVLTDQHSFYAALRLVLRLFGREIATSRLTRYLDNSPTDLVYFLSPAPEAWQLNLKPYIWTLWDLFHLDHPEFPELRTSGKFEARENSNQRSIRKASAVVVDSNELVEKAKTYFGANIEKFVVIPYSTPANRKTTKGNPAKLPAQLRPLEGKYFFYPAQLWTHKNHQRIVEAIRQLVDEGLDVNAIFVGRDHGAGKMLAAIITKFNLADRIHVLGYVEDEAIPVLYRESLGLVMASYVGPNIPPLEAMDLGVPIIATTVHKPQLSSSALYFDPDDHEELAQRMREVMSPRTRERLVKKGRNRLSEIGLVRDAGLVMLEERIQRIIRRTMSA